ncbi:diguanylate cyclase [Pseudomonas sp. S 311-6]|uniref:diguanylate cyclase n=1 Tax=Pseudomonas TaxID=286 RepID=UPI002097C234|nr:MULTISPECIES: diguanylate cyclase [Pseudomonas]MCO7566174.1 diguanylate cyclase [Pseudomonas mosselii]MCO7617266.1 diguanylate cyclase [Pseudomonas guariconensis]MCO7637333.1 diguanylate cyclase [Pseudomonas sp. S 311-6]
MSERTGKGLSFAKRMYVPRAIGTGLGFFCVMIGIWPLQPAWWTWALLVAHGFVWPHLAFQIARLSSQPFRCEQRNLVFDGFAGGCWAGVMGLNPLPSVIILSMIAMDKIAAGGWHMLFKTLLAQLLGIGLGLWLYAPPLFPETSQVQMLACLPILLVYPMAIGMICYRVTVLLGEHKRALARLSQTDSLTGLINHGAWKDLLLREFEHCRANHLPNTLALIDIDHFKQINDGHGHLAGDNILRIVSAFFSSYLRKSDPVARYGGDEFCVMLPGTTPAQAREILERLRQAVEEYRDPALAHLRLSLSIGIAPFGLHLTNAEAWLHEADTALYQAKSEGRNRTVVAGTSWVNWSGNSSTGFQPQH